jgi:pyruvate,water dikinase
MSQIGLRVPAGFCVTAHAYQHHVAASGIARRIASVLDGIALAPLESKKSILSDIREAIAEAPMSELVRQAIGEYYRQLGAPRVAVRSSATAEDLPGQSFAGQYDTILGVADLDECIAAIKKCWASLWTERAYDYRQKNSFDHLAVSMAVIVQSLAAADASGVLFTADPTTGRSDRIIIEACFGLGEALVGGWVTPDRFVVAKRDLRLVSQIISQKQTECAPDEQGGVHHRPVGPERVSCPSIDKRTVIKLARLARNAEREFGCPQDMEWAVHGRKILFVQSRPITTLPASRSWEERQVWTNANLGEVVPDVMTPMTYSVILTGGQAFLASVLRLLGIDFDAISHAGKDPLADLIAGRIYFNVNTCLGLIRGLPGGRWVNFGKLFGGEQARLSDLGQLDIPDEDIPHFKFSVRKMILRLPWSIHSILAHGRRGGQIRLKELATRNNQLHSLVLSHMSERELADEVMVVIEDGMQTFDVLYGVVALAPLPLLYKICERWLGDTDGALANGLLTGVGNMVSTAAGIDLWRLARQAHETPAVEQELLSADGWLSTRTRIQAVNGGREFLESWDCFMVRHGHHCRGEIELYNQRWSETPDYVLKLVRGYLGQVDQTDPVQGYEERSLQRRRIEERCRRQLKNPMKWMIFCSVLTRAQTGSGFRENLKSEGMRWLTALRRILLELGARLVGRGVLNTPDDVFFLTLEELAATARGETCADVRQMVADRRAERERNELVAPPKVVVGRFDPTKSVPDTIDAGADVLKGLGASAGVVTGKAHVILRADTDEQLLAGEILVAPFTDAGWTPYFVPAAGIVIEQGGLLSHGSIIAREYGIPAVVNVGHATRILQPGQTIRVDGNRGIVTILR